MCPYIITTKTPEEDFHRKSRVAVATLDDAREIAYEAMADASSIYLLSDAAVIAEGIDTLPESGGTIGPLPDGTIIEVERVTVRYLAESVDYGDPRWGRTRAVAAYNTQEGQNV